MPKVLISDDLSPRAAEILAARGIEVDMLPGITAEELKTRIAGYDGLAVRSATKVTAELLARAPELKIIGRAGIGVDNIDVAAATQRGIVVMNTPYGNSTTAAEHAIAMLFALCREIPAADRSTQAGKWEKSRFMGVELTGKTLGLIGCGNVGASVAVRALGLRMKVVAYDPFLSAERAIDLGVEKVEPRRAFGARRFRHIAHALDRRDPKHDRRRGDRQDEARGADRELRARRARRRGGSCRRTRQRSCRGCGNRRLCRGAGAQKPALWPRQCRCDTRISAPPRPRRRKMSRSQIAEQMADYLLTGAVANAVNVPSLTAEEAKRIRPYIALAEQLGSFAGQLTETGITAVSVEYEGAIAELNVKPLTAIVLTALLAPQLASVNMVNAPVICRDRDIRVSETRRAEPGDYQTLIRVVVTPNGPPAERRQREVCRHPVWRRQAASHLGRGHPARG